MTDRQLAAVAALQAHVAAHGYGATVGALATAIGVSVVRASEVAVRLEVLGAARIQRGATGRIVAVWPASTVCHAGAGHGPAEARGAWGALCEPCWARVRALFAVPA